VQPDRTSGPADRARTRERPRVTQGYLESGERGNRFADMVQTRAFLPCRGIPTAVDLIGERGGTRTLDPMIKSHVLYRLSYALTRRAV
jgi:hypothetical protein